jgi:DNA-binding SARP family transcriptional activator
LLRNNSMVPASELIKALWPNDTPATGRKMLHNAISRVRGVLTAHDRPTDCAVLLTHAPGYFLRVQPEALDLTCFQTQAQQGHAELLAGSWEQAARTLREALGLWRGPALVDLVEAGIVWPELVALENAKLVALEDCVEAELACGRHAEVVGELEVCVENGPLRERMSGQLMRVLYRCGRQADALCLYQRTRAALIEQFGLDPSPELQALERAILNHDLTSESGLARPSVAPMGGVPLQHRPVTLAARPASHRAELSPLVVSSTVRAGEDDQAGEIDFIPQGRDSGVILAETPVSPELAGELKQVSMVLVLATSEPGDAAEAEHTDLIRQYVCAAVRENAERWGGMVAGTLGPLWLVVFGAPRNYESDSWRAVQAAFAIRNQFAGEGVSALKVSGATVTVSVAVATGDALVRPQGSGPGMLPMVTGPVVDRSLLLLTNAAAGEVSICDETLRASKSVTFDFKAIAGTCDPKAELAEPPAIERYADAPFIGREHDLHMLTDWLPQVQRLRRTQLVTVLGTAGMGKSRLISEFEREIRDHPNPVRYLSGRVAPLHTGPSGLSALAEIVCSYANIKPTDASAIAQKKLAAAVRGLSGLGERSTWVFERLQALISGDRRAGDGDALLAWSRFLEEVAAELPTVLVVEDLHLADDVLIQLVDHLANSAGSIPLLVVVTARLELLERRPGWGGGKLHATTTTLQPLSDADVERLLGFLCSSGGWAEHRPEWQPVPIALSATFGEVVAKVDGNPLFAVEYARMLLDRDSEGDTDREKYRQKSRLRAVGHHDDRGSVHESEVPLALPSSVRSVLGARIDMLPPVVKAVLLDAAVLGDAPIAAVAALGPRGADEAQRCLEYLERWEFMVRAGRLPVAVRPEYVFRHDVIREVAYSRLPKATLAAKNQRAAEWFDQQAVMTESVHSAGWSAAGESSRFRRGRGA